MKREGLIKRSDLMLIVPALLLGAVLFLAVYGNMPEGNHACVFVDGKETARYSMEKDGEYTIRGYTGQGTNRLVIKDRKAWIETADCPDRICVRHSPVSRKGETIICLPHRVVVEIAG